MAKLNIGIGGWGGTTPSSYYSNTYTVNNFQIIGDAEKLFRNANLNQRLPQSINRSIKYTGFRVKRRNRSIGTMVDFEEYLDDPNFKRYPLRIIRILMQNQKR